MRRGTEVKLTPTEWHLVEALVRRPGTLVPGAVWEVRAPNAPLKVGLLDGYVTVDFGHWHFHVCIGHFNGATDEADAHQRRTGRAELYRVLGKRGPAGSESCRKRPKMM